MTIVLCLDKNGGRSFNNRRQSRDRKLIDDLCDLAGEREIYIAPYSEKLFAHTGHPTVAREDYLDLVPEDGICFCEREAVSPVFGRASQIVIYRWNKEYPADRVFDVDLGAEGFRFYRKTDFPGTSHNDIDREVYVR